MAKNDKVRIDGFTRDELLKNNADIIRGEGGNEDDVFFNEIETRLRLPIEQRNEADDRLGGAYIACLAQYEAEDEQPAGWSPFSVNHLVHREKVTPREAEVVSIMAAREYPTKDTTRDDLVRFFKWLHTNTDTFDPVMVKLTLDNQDKLGFSEEQQAEMVDAFLSNK